MEKWEFCQLNGGVIGLNPDVLILIERKLGV